MATEFEDSLDKCLQTAVGDLVDVTACKVYVRTFLGAKTAGVRIHSGGADPVSSKGERLLAAVM